MGTGEPAREGGRRNFSYLRGQGSFGAGLEVPFQVWTFSQGVEVALGGVGWGGGLPWGDRRGEEQGHSGMTVILGSNALIEVTPHCHFLLPPSFQRSFPVTKTSWLLSGVLREGGGGPPVTPGTGAQEE